MGAKPSQKHAGEHTFVEDKSSQMSGHKTLLCINNPKSTASLDTSFLTCRRMTTANRLGTWTLGLAYSFWLYSL